MFVANRIKPFHTLSSIEQWKYVLSTDNPANLASGSLSPRKLESADIWFNGPAFLRAPEEEWPDQPKFVAELSVQE